MTLEERIELLESELTKLRGKPVVYATSAYAVARQNCKAYFKSVQGEEQNYAGHMGCEQLARTAFKEKHGAVGKGNNTPNQYIRTEEDAAEYFELFKAFLSVYQRYLNGGEAQSEQAG